ncbi:MAG: VWD domain-containing protein [Almyronema sp.]
MFWIQSSKIVRGLGLFLAGLFTTLAFSSLPAPAQTASTGAFCRAATEALADPVQGRSYGDPHIQTYDGYHYSFQTIGEFILSKSSDGSFEVQTRQGRVADHDSLSLNTAVAMNVCGHRVAIYIEDPNGDRETVWIDGERTRIRNAESLAGGGEVQKLSDSDYAVIWPSGDQVLIHFINVSGDRFLNVMPTIRRDRRNALIGLLGNFNGNPDDDLMSRNGSVLPARSTYSVATNALDSVLPAIIPVRQVEDAYFSDLYRRFGDSWRISQEESLFDYGSGQSTVSFTDRSFPSQYFTLNGVAPARLESALTACREAGVAEQLLDGCVFDVAATGNNSFANAALNAVGNAVVQELRDRILDEIIPGPIRRFPF